MTIARTVSRLLIAAGFATSSLAFAQGQTETPAAPAVAPEVAPEAAAPEGDPADAAPARSVLWPDFQVGQHVVLEMMYLDTSKAPKPILATITIDVLDKTDDVFTIRWTPSNARIPREFNEGRMMAFHCIMNGTAGPTLEVLIQEDVGVIGLRNWQEAGDALLADVRKELLVIADMSGGAMTPENVDSQVDSLKRMLFSTRDGVETTLLKNMRAYFDGSYHKVAPGESETSEFDVPWPFAQTQGDLMLPMTRTLSLATITVDPSPVYELSISVQPNPEKMKELLTSFIQSMPEGMKTKQVEELGNSTIENKIRWTFDTAKGWPTRTSATTRLKNGDQVTTQTSGFTLVEGPTMVAKDEAQSAESQPAAPARP
jgi:hypothetical protein